MFEPWLKLRTFLARAALETDLGDADLYRSNLVGAVIRLKLAPTPEQPGPYYNGQCGICDCQFTSIVQADVATPTP